MPTVILLAFQYEDLDSAIIDIYKVYTFYKKLNYEIIIGTDIFISKYPDNIPTLIRTKSIESGLSYFINNVFSKIRFFIKNYETFLDFIKICKEKIYSHRLFFYYSGHGYDGHIVLPDQYKYSFLDLKKELLNLVSSYIQTPEIFILLDCCYSNGLILPFEFVETEFKQINNNFTQCKILLISSSHIKQESHIKSNQSLFTFYFFRYLEKIYKPYDIKSILSYISQKIKKHQPSKDDKHAYSYASYTTLDILWSWLVFSNINIEYDYDNLCLVIKHEHSIH